MITVQQAIELIIYELRSAQKQHPYFPTDPIHAVAIMAEEAGEAVQASLDFTYGGKHAEKLQKEIIQTGAMAVRNLINFHNFKAIKSPQIKD
jgi:hypothetical protein